MRTTPPPETTDQTNSVTVAPAQNSTSSAPPSPGKGRRTRSTRNRS
ncbi:MAG: hypothetical protein LUG58_03885 [Clostridiales bacterium]|nr:hypothetical protein [Clostridiales bacterium]